MELQKLRKDIYTYLITQVRTYTREISCHIILHEDEYKCLFHALYSLTTRLSPLFLQLNYVVVTGMCSRVLTTVKFGQILHTPGIGKYYSEYMRIYRHCHN